MKKRLQACSWQPRSPSLCLENPPCSGWLALSSHTSEPRSLPPGSLLTPPGSLSALPWGSRYPPCTPSAAPKSKPTVGCQCPGEGHPGRGLSRIRAQWNLSPWSVWGLVVFQHLISGFLALSPSSPPLYQEVVPKPQPQLLQGRW